MNIKLAEQKLTMDLKSCTGVHEEGSVKIGCGYYDFRQEISRKVKSMDKSWTQKAAGSNYSKNLH